MLGARARGEQEAAARSGQAAWPAALAARPLAPPAGASRAREAAGPAALDSPHRLLLGDSPARDGARLRIEGGRFAGTEIHLVVTGSAVEVSVLTPHEASRQTLSIAMEAVRNRLRARGLTMVDAPASAGRSPRPTWRQSADREAPLPARRPGDDDASEK